MKFGIWPTLDLGELHCIEGSDSGLQARDTTLPADSKIRRTLVGPPRQSAADDFQGRFGGIHIKMQNEPHKSRQRTPTCVAAPSLKSKESCVSEKSSNGGKFRASGAVNRAKRTPVTAKMASLQPLLSVAGWIKWSGSGLTLNAFSPDSDDARRAVLADFGGHLALAGPEGGMG